MKASPLPELPLIKFHYLVKSEIELTKDEIEYLRSMSATHVDRTCQSAGEQDGFIYSWWMRSKFGDNENERIQVDSRQIDILCKILEQELGKPPSVQGQYELYYKMKRLHAKVKSEEDRINNNAETRADDGKESRAPAFFKFIFGA